MSSIVTPPFAEAMMRGPPTARSYLLKCYKNIVKEGCCRVQDGKVFLHLGGERFNHEHRVAWTAFSSSLLGDEAVAQHGVGGFGGGFGRLHNVNAALKAGVELSKTTTSGENLWRVRREERRWRRQGERGGGGEGALANWDRRGKNVT